eukprot:scaffold22089_cov22-Tisochrysis_lutea.AAC.2
MPQHHRKRKKHCFVCWAFSSALMHARELKIKLCMHSSKKQATSVFVSMLVLSCRPRACLHALVGLPQSGRHVSISSSMPASQPSGAPAAQQPEPPVEKDATLQKLAQGKDFGCFDDGAPWFGWAAGH